MINLILAAVIVYAGYQAYKTYTDRGNSISPLDEYFNAFVKRLLLKK
jgi:hypothetical protein